MIADERPGAPSLRTPWTGFEPTGRDDVDALLKVATRFSRPVRLLRALGLVELQRRWGRLPFDERHPFIDEACGALDDRGWVAVAGAMPPRDRDRAYGLILIVASTRMLRRARARWSWEERALLAGRRRDDLYAAAHMIAGIGLPYLNFCDVAEDLLEIMRLRNASKRISDDARRQGVTARA